MRPWGSPRREIEDVEVRPGVVDRGGLRDRGDVAVLNASARHLRGRFAVLLPDRLQGRVAGRAALGERAVGGQEQPQPPRLAQHRLLVQEGMVFHLVADDVRAVLLHRFAHQRDREVGDADVAHLARALQVRQRAQGLRERHPVVRPVDQQQVEIVGAQLRQAVLGRRRQVGVVQLVHPHLGGQEHPVARHFGVADAGTHGLLVAVHLGRIDVAIADRQRRLHHLAAALPLEREGAETECWHAHAVGGNHRLSIGRHRFYLRRRVLVVVLSGLARAVRPPVRRASTRRPLDGCSA